MHQLRLFRPGNVFSLLSTITSCTLSGIVGQNKRTHWRGTSLQQKHLHVLKTHLAYGML